MFMTKSKTICNILSDKVDTSKKIQNKNLTKTFINSLPFLQKQNYSSYFLSLPDEEKNITNESMDSDIKVVAYIYTINNKEIIIGCVRKGVRGCRNYRYNYKLKKAYSLKPKEIKEVGASGTLPIYWGKWGSIGGSKNKRSNNQKEISNIESIINEINDECGISDPYKINYEKHVYINLNYFTKNVDDIKKIKLNLKCCKNINNNVIFIFNMPYNNFIKIFPKNGRTNKELFSSSDGEIDAIKSFTLEDILKKQKDQIKKNNNYFIKYFIETLKTIFIPYLIKEYELFKYYEYIQKINVIQNINDLLPNELTHKPYTYLKK